MSNFVEIAISSVTSMVITGAVAWALQQRQVRTLRSNIAALARKRHVVASANETLFRSRPRRAVIFTLGLNSTAPDSVVHYVSARLKPELVGFLGTPVTEAKQVVPQLCEALNLSEGDFKSEAWEVETLWPDQPGADRYSALEEGIRKTGIVIDWLMRQHRLRSDEIVVDITGGMAIMSLAAFLAAEERGIDCQYIQSRFNRSNNTIEKGSQRPLLISYHLPAEGSKAVVSMSQPVASLETKQRT